MSERGYTLVELMTVVGLLSIVALVAIPAVAPSERYKLDLAAAEVADLIRFVQSEAQRTGGAYGFQTQVGANRVRAFRADLGTVPPTPIFDVLDPISKRPYDIDLDERQLLRGVELTGETPTWLGICNAPTLVGFDAAGIPRCADPWPVLLDDDALSFSFGNATLQIQIEGETGRVTVQ